MSDEKRDVPLGHMESDPAVSPAAAMAYLSDWKIEPGTLAQDSAFALAGEAPAGTFAPPDPDKIWDHWFKPLSEHTPGMCGHVLRSFPFGAELCGKVPGKHMLVGHMSPPPEQR